jgi:hypothetical protein
VLAYAAVDPLGDTLEVYVRREDASASSRKCGETSLS